MKRELTIVKNKYGIKEDNNIKYVLYRLHWVEILEDSASLIEDEELLLELWTFLSDEQESLMTASHILNLMDDLNEKIFNSIGETGMENYICFALNSIGKYGHAIEFYGHQLWFSEEDDREYFADIYKDRENAPEFSDGILKLFGDIREPLIAHINREYEKFKALLLKVSLEDKTPLP